MAHHRFRDFVPSAVRAVACLGLLIGAHTATAAEDAARPNIIFIMADDNCEDCTAVCAKSRKAP